MSNEKANRLAKLGNYGTLNNEARLKTFVLIHDSPQLSFDELAQKMCLETGQLAYHIGLLKASNLVKVTYERKKKVVSFYSLTSAGKMIYDELFAK
jgi:predicted transcriptional regulator